MIHRRMLFLVLIIRPILALADQTMAADAVDRPANLRLWENRDQDANALSGPELRIPETHPYLALTPQDVERAKDRAARWDWAKRAIERCRSEADGHVNKPWDKLNLVLYARGRQWLPDFGSMPYETSDKAEWTAHTVSHNTVVADGVSQRPSGARDRQWPVDSASDRVIGKLEQFDPAAGRVTASCDSAYEGITLRRTVQLCRHCVVDDYVVAAQAAADSPHQFDYVLHVDGDLAESSLPLEPRSGRLGDACGYQRVERKLGTSTAEAVTLRFTSGKQQLRVWIVPADGNLTEVMLAEGPTNRPDARMPMLLLRRTAARTRFVTVLEPVQQAESLQAVRAETGADGNRISLILEWSTGSDRVLLP